MNKIIKDSLWWWYLLLLTLTLNRSHAQTDSLTGSSTVISMTQDYNNSNYYVYNPPLTIKANYKDSLEAKNQYPEELMMSTLSADNQGWVNYNTLGGKGSQKSEKHFTNIKKMDRNKNYFELHSKYQFDFNAIPTAIVKFYVYIQDQSKPISGSTTMQKVNGRWYVTTVPGTENLGVVLMRFQSDKIAQLFKGEKTGNQIMDDMIGKTRSVTGGLDFEKLVAEYSSWYENKTFNQPKIDYFIDKNAW